MSFSLSETPKTDFLELYLGKVRILTLSAKLYLRKVRILTLFADSRTVPDSSRMVQRYFIDFRLGPGLAQSRNWLNKVDMASGIK